MKIENVSVNVELLSNTLVSGGVFNGLPTYYSYDSNVKKNWTITAYVDIGEYTDLLERVNFFGYNKDNLSINSGNIKGNITSVSINSKVYTPSQELLLITINLTEFPSFKSPDTDSSTEESYQIAIAGYYLDGSGYLSNNKDSGTLVNKLYTKKLNDRAGAVPTSFSGSGGGGSSIPAQAGSGGGNVNGFKIGGIVIDNTFRNMNGVFSEILISSSPSNFRYVINESGDSTLYADFQDTFLKDWSLEVINVRT